MLELASERAGGRVVMVSSLDPAHPGESAIDGNDESYWISTGLYPQELLLELGQSAAVASVWVTSTHVRKLRIEGCQEESPVNFTTLSEEELDDTHGRLQLRELGCIDNQQPIRFVRVLVMSGWCDFCSFHRIQVMGKAVAPRAEPGQGSPLARDGQSSGSEEFEESKDSVSPTGALSGTGGSASWGDHPYDADHFSAGRSRQSSRAMDASINETSGEDESWLPNDRMYWLQLVQRDGWRLADAPAAIKSDREVVLAAVAQDGMALEHAAEHLRADREIVLAALNQDPWAGQYMAEVLQFSPECDEPM